MSDFSHEMIITKNKFVILLNHVKNAKTILVESYINNGTVDEKLNNLGISHLLEHVCTDGWKKCNHNCTKYFKPQGSIINASTGQTYINYWIKGLPEYLDDMLEYIVTISTNPEVDKNRLKKEKAAVENELKIHETYPQIGLYQLLNHMLFTPEGLQEQDNIQAQIDLLPSLTPEKLRNWAKNYYGAGNTVFSITGNFNKKRILNKLNKKLIKEPTPKVRPYYKNIFKSGLDIQYFKNTHVQNTTIFFVFWSPIFYSDKDVFLIELFKEFINSGTTSLLFEKLREKLNLIYNIQLDHHIMPYGTYLLIEISTKNNNVRKVVKETIKLLKKLAANKFTKDDFNAIKRSYEVGHHQMAKTNDFYSSHYAEQYINQLFNINENTKVVSPHKMLDIIKNVKQQEFAAFINKLLIFSNLKIAYQGKKFIKDLSNDVKRLI